MHRNGVGMARPSGTVLGLACPPSFAAGTHFLMSVPDCAQRKQPGRGADSGMQKRGARFAASHLEAMPCARRRGRGGRRAGSDGRGAGRAVRGAQPLWHAALLGGAARAAERGGHGRHARHRQGRRARVPAVRTPGFVGPRGALQIFSQHCHMSTSKASHVFRQTCGSGTLSLHCLTLHRL